MKNSYVKTLLVTAMLTAAFFPAAFGQEKATAAPATDSARVSGTDSLPTVSQLRESRSANTYLQDYLIGKLGQLSQAYRKDSVTGKALLVSAFGYPFDTVIRWAASYGDDYLLTLLAPKWCTGPVVEYFLAARIRHYCDEKYYETALQILKDYQSRFPNGEYLDSCRNEIAILERRIAANNQNAGIVFHEISDKPSMAAILAAYIGKIVYLDIWGTWCGPCREEMQASPALKKHFEGKDIVFLYLDMDSPEARDKWHNFVRMEAITGEHYRLSSDQMEDIWQSLLPGKKDHFYPSYFIFDRTGHVIVTDARRPSDKEGLYAQLEMALKN
jgi:thiol-disulfide isomerase/thioredoxin